MISISRRGVGRVEVKSDKGDSLVVAADDVGKEVASIAPYYGEQIADVIAKLVSNRGFEAADVYYAADDGDERYAIVNYRAIKVDHLVVTAATSPPSFRKSHNDPLDIDVLMTCEIPYRSIQFEIAEDLDEHTCMNSMVVGSGMEYALLSRAVAMLLTMCFGVNSLTAKNAGDHVMALIMHNKHMAANMRIEDIGRSSVTITVKERIIDIIEIGRDAICSA